MKMELALLITEIKINIIRGQNSARRKFRETKFPHGKISARDISTRFKFYAAKFPAMKYLSYEICSLRNYRRQNFLY